jgi:hypothetical protein
MKQKIYYKLIIVPIVILLIAIFITQMVFEKYSTGEIPDIPMLNFVFIVLTLVIASIVVSYKTLSIKKKKSIYIFTVKNMLDWFSKDLNKKHLNDELVFYDKTNDRFLNIYNFEIYRNGKVCIQLTDNNPKYVIKSLMYGKKTKMIYRTLI